MAAIQKSNMLKIIAALIMPTGFVVILIFLVLTITYQSHIDLIKKQGQDTLKHLMFALPYPNASIIISGIYEKNISNKLNSLLNFGHFAFNKFFGNRRFAPNSISIFVKVKHAYRRGPMRTMISKNNLPRSNSPLEGG